MKIDGIDPNIISKTSNKKLADVYSFFVRLVKSELFGNGQPSKKVVADLLVGNKELNKMIVDLKETQSSFSNGQIPSTLVKSDNYNNVKGNPLQFYETSISPTELFDPKILEFSDADDEVLDATILDSKEIPLLEGQSMPKTSNFGDMQVTTYPEANFVSVTSETTGNTFFFIKEEDGLIPLASVDATGSIQVLSSEYINDNTFLISPEINQDKELSVFADTNTNNLQEPTYKLETDLEGMVNSDLLLEQNNLELSDIPNYQVETDLESVLDSVQAPALPQSSDIAQ
jgi:hypothetical protein